MQRTLGLLAGAVAAVLLAGCGNTTVIGSTPTATATPFPISVTNEYAIPTAASNPGGLVKGPDGSVWFTEINGNKIGKLSQAAVVTDYAVPSAGAMPQTITVGPDGALWFTELGRPAIGRLGISNLNFTEIALPNAGARPWGIVTAANGSLWVTDNALNAIWQITPAGVVSEYPISAPNAKPTSITIGPDSAIWYVESGNDHLGKLLPDAVAGSSGVDYPVTPGAGPAVVISGSDNAIWFTETTAKKIGRMLTNGALSSETTLPGVSAPFGIVLGGDGNFYIGDHSGSQIAQFNPTTKTTNLYPTLSKNSMPYLLTLGPDNEVYFSEQGSNNIAQLRYF